MLECSADSCNEKASNPRKWKKNREKKKKENREEQAFSRKLQQILHLTIPTLPIAEGMTETLGMVLVWQGANFTTSSIHSQNPGKLWSPVHAFGINSSDQGFLQGPGYHNCHTKLLNSSFSLSNGFAVWSSICYRSGEKMFILSWAGAKTSSSCPPNHEEPLEHSFTPQELEINEAFTNWVINCVLLNPEKEIANWPSSVFIGISPCMNH